MNVYAHAAQIWSILALAARNRQVLTYDIVSRLIGIPRWGLGRHLEPIQSYCLVHDLPPLTSLVVSEVNGLPSPGFTAAADVPREQIRVMAFDWLAHPAPTPSLLEQTVEQQPSNGGPAVTQPAAEPLAALVGAEPGSS